MEKNVVTVHALNKVAIDYLYSQQMFCQEILDSLINFRFVFFMNQGIVPRTCQLHKIEVYLIFLQGSDHHFCLAIGYDIVLIDIIIIELFRKKLVKNLCVLIEISVSRIITLNGIADDFFRAVQ